MLDLVVVMPAYNEEDCIAKALDSWLSILAGLNIKFRILVFNDGSTDATAKAIEAFGKDDRIVLINKENSGHGPTVLAGYKMAVKTGSWVFQCDSDNEIDPLQFTGIWNKRDSFDALFGIRKKRKQNISRRIISSSARLIVRCFFGKSRITDVNIPFRLIRSDILKQIIAYIPENTFAPNIIVSGLLSKSKARIYEQGLLHRCRETGAVSIVKWKLWALAFKSLWQTIIFYKNIKIYGQLGEKNGM